MWVTWSTAASRTASTAVRSLPGPRSRARPSQRTPVPSQLDRRLWAEVVAAFVAQVVVFGALYTFGVVLDDVGRALGVGRGAIGFVPALAAASLFFLGPLSGRAADRWGTGRVVLVGAALLPAGLLVTASARTLSVAVVGFGLMGGAAASCVYVPAVAAVAARAGPGRALPSGIVVAGVGTGTALVAPLLRSMVNEMGWRTTYRGYALVAGIALVTVAAVFAHDARTTRARRSASRTPMTANRSFAGLYGALLLASPSMYVGLLFLASEAEAFGVTAGRRSALLSVFGLAGTLARVLVAALGRRIPLEHAFRASFALLAASLPLWAIAGGDYSTLLGYAIVAGTGYGGVIGLAPTITARRYGTNDLAGRLGLLYTSLGIGGLVTGPTVGAALDRYGAVSTLLALTAVTAAATMLLPRAVNQAPQH